MKAVLFGAVIALITYPHSAAAQANPVVLSGPWGPMTEESPARPIFDSGDAAIRVRQAHMRSVSAQFRSVEALMLAGTADDPLALAASRDLAELAERNALIFGGNVPRRGAFGAKASIWNEPDEFAEHVRGFLVATQRMQSTIESKQFARLAGDVAAVRYQCLACHYHYAHWEGRPGVEGRRIGGQR
jgi:cytochrome c556